MLGEAAAASRVCTRQAALKERPKSSDSEVMSESYACTAEQLQSSNSEPAQRSPQTCRRSLCSRAGRERGALRGSLAAEAGCAPKGPRRDSKLYLAQTNLLATLQRSLFSLPPPLIKPCPKSASSYSRLEEPLRGGTKPKPKPRRAAL